MHHFQVRVDIVIISLAEVNRVSQGKVTCISLDLNKVFGNVNLNF